jgi:hypothetical protein
LAVYPDPSSGTALKININEADPWQLIAGVGCYQTLFFVINAFNQ